jgi:hydroxymethylpyrimidine/phosphomethylpyrimidine kinase
MCSMARVTDLKMRSGDVNILNLLSIAGSDPSGGAGIQADIKTFAALGCYGMAVVTALTAQNTQRVVGVHLLPADFVAAQIDAIFVDVDVHAVKIGMLGSGEIARVVADRLNAKQYPIILDPVLVATSGDALGTHDLVDAIRERLMPLATLVTPNLSEVARLADRPVPRHVEGMQHLAERLHALGARAVLVKGGHLTGAETTDVLFDGKSHRLFTGLRVDTGGETHGTGCTLSAAIAAYLTEGFALGDAVEAAKGYLTETLRASGELRVGHGAAPLNHFCALRNNEGG